MKVIFMGTPHFAVPALKALIESNHQIMAVYTKAPKPAGRGYAEVKSPVHQLAYERGIEVVTPRSLRDIAAQEVFASYKADIAVVAAYGLILPQEILDAPRYGCINIHPSLLPRWRGAAPIQHTVLSGDHSTAVCIMQMDAGLDTGDILLQKEFALAPSIKACELHDQCAALGAEMVLETLTMIENQSLSPKPQTDVGVCYAHKLTRADEKIDWSNTATQVDCQIRTFSPRPGAYFVYQGEIIKIIEALVIDGAHGKPGEVMDEQLTIACAQGAIRPTLLQREGKKMIYSEAFLRGYKIEKGQVLS